MPPADQSDNDHWGTATVQVEDIWLGMHFDDTLKLLREKAGWSIIPKVFYLRPS